MNASIKYLLTGCFLLLLLQCSAQFFIKPANRLNEQGKRQGVWKSFWDEAGKVPMSKARYKDGREVGVSKEYHISGILRLKFRYHKNRIRVKYYDENRQLEQKGWSVMEFTDKEIRYYWQGKWKFYDSKRHLERISYYDKGEDVTHLQAESGGPRP